MTSLLESCFVSIPTHSMPTQYAYTVCLAVCLTVCLCSIPQNANSQYPRHRNSLNSKFHNLKSQNKILKHFRLVCEKLFFRLPTHSMPHSMHRSMPTLIILHRVAYTLCLT